MLQKEMELLVKERAKRLLNLDKKIVELGNAIDDGDTNIFFLAMFGKDVMLKSKLLMSLQTAFGMSFYEQISKSLGELVGFQVENQFKLKGYIPDEVNQFLERTLNTNSYLPDRNNEYEILSNLYKKAHNENRIGNLILMPDSTIDVFIKKPNGEEFFIDITTVKPNKKEFRTMKRKILTWYFMRLSHGDISPDKIKTYMAIPYNPESLVDNTYTRWNSYYDREDLLVGDQLWKLVSNNVFSLKKLLAVFEQLGEEYQKNPNNFLG